MKMREKKRSKFFDSKWKKIGFAGFLIVLAIVIIVSATELQVSGAIKSAGGFMVRDILVIEPDGKIDWNKLKNLPPSVGGNCYLDMRENECVFTPWINIEDPGPISCADEWRVKAIDKKIYGSLEFQLICCPPPEIICN